MLAWNGPIFLIEIDLKSRMSTRSKTDLTNSRMSTSADIRHFSFQSEKSYVHLGGHTTTHESYQIRFYDHIELAINV